MLQLKKIVKKYQAGDTTVTALKGIDLSFRESEFVSVLGPSGCGKTTLLNVVGGLDQYDSGDLSINGKSTKQFRDSDWDSYRNHSIGFVFQSYNLIPHQTVLANVELALTLSGVAKTERRRRAEEALEKVGLGDQMHKRPNQMSGGQMQRVAIARALVNDPDILLADEPTGALDTQTSVQIMEILKTISKDKLIIMVTHNPDLAEQYSTRIIRLLDGNVVGDSNPYQAESKVPTDAQKRIKKPSMSFFTALSLSLTNLMTKKARTFLTAFAGSIGIIGIALILSLSSGIQTYIDDVQRDTLSSYPITIESESVDISSLMQTMMGSDKKADSVHELDQVYSSTMMADMMNTMLTIETRTNNLSKFKEFIESENSGLGEYVSAVQYSYGTTLDVYASDTSDGVYQVNPSTVFEKFQPAAASQQGNTGNPMTSMMESRFDIWDEMLTGRDGELINSLLTEQYDLLAGAWPSAYDEVILIVDKNNEINDIYLYSLALKDPDEVDMIMDSVMEGNTIDAVTESWSYDDLVGMTFQLVLPTDYYQYDKESNTYKDMRDNETYMSYAVSSGLELKVTGIIRPHEDALATTMTGAIGYTSALTEYVINAVQDSEIVQAQVDAPDTDIFSGLPFDDGSEDELSESEKADAVSAYFSSLSEGEKASLYIDIASIPSGENLAEMMAQMMARYPNRTAKEAAITQMYTEAAGMSEETIASYLASMSDEEIDAAMTQLMQEAASAQYAQQVADAMSAMTTEQIVTAFDSMLLMLDEPAFADLYDRYMPATVSDATYSENLSLLGVSDLSSPTTINIYAASFEDKDTIASIIQAYNQSADENDQISYTDYVALMMSSITTIINAISYVLIAFVAISLVVSSIMIGIITYISVLERTKEIGVLRSIGASKRDISRVFNAETLIVGFTSGMIGIAITIMLCFPINAIIRALSGINNIGAALPVAGGVILVLISMLLTFIAGLIPSRIAAKKDPVVALRSE